MSELKFRVWEYDYSSFEIYTITNIQNGMLMGRGLLHYEQFTGLLDRNGKELYVGDIVFSEKWNPQNQEVVFDRGGFCLKYDDSGYYLDIKYAEQIEVIGNIHEPYYSFNKPTEWKLKSSGEILADIENAKNVIRNALNKNPLQP